MVSIKYIRSKNQLINKKKSCISSIFIKKFCIPLILIILKT